MSKIISVLASAILIIIILTSPVLAPMNTGQSANEDFDRIFQDTVADFALYTSLLYDVYSLNQYRVSLHANNPESAATYLTGGFNPSLATDIVGYYLQWLPEFNKIAVIPTDSIPIITEADKSFLKMQRISPDKVILERTYTDCYELGDKYLYRITAEQKDGHWIIVDLQLDCL